MPAGTDNTALADWAAELAQVVERSISMPELRGWRSVFRHIPPKLVTLPNWWPYEGIGAWSYMRYILVSPGLLTTAPKEVRRYIIGHELGHIRFGHTALNYLFPATFVAFFSAMMVFESQPQGTLKTVSAILMLLLLVPKSALLWFPKRREFQADAHAAWLYGRDATLRASLWMAEAGGDHSALRQARLRRLGYQGDF